MALLRQELDLGQKELAALLDCTFETIKSVELGRLKLSNSLALRISLETGVSAEWLVANDIASPIRPSFKAQDLQAGAEIEPWSEYSKDTFELVRAHQSVPGDCTEVYMEQRRGLADYVRLRAIIESARARHRYEVARYKVNCFLAEMEKEFQSDPSKMFLGGQPVNYQNSFGFVSAELEQAKRTDSTLRIEYTERFPGEWRQDGMEEVYQEAAEQAFTEELTMEVVSPYEDRSDPKVVAKIKAHFAGETKEIRAKPKASTTKPKRQK